MIKNEKELNLIEIVSARSSLKVPRISATVYSARRPGFYIFNGFFLNFMITIVSLAVFAIDTKTPHFRLQTTYEFNYIFLRALPSISYLTTLDVYQIVNFTFMCLLVAWHAIVASFWERMYSRYLDKIMVTIVEL